MNKKIFPNREYVRIFKGRVLKEITLNTMQRIKGDYKYKDLPILLRSEICDSAHFVGIEYIFDVWNTNDTDAMFQITNPTINIKPNGKFTMSKTQITRIEKAYKRIVQYRLKNAPTNSLFNQHNKK